LYIKGQDWIWFFVVVIFLHFFIDFTPKNHILSNCGGRREKFWGISCEKSRFYAQKIIFFSNLGGARAGSPGSAPGLADISKFYPSPLARDKTLISAIPC
jgi:hypothetical protein